MTMKYARINMTKINRFPHTHHHTVERQLEKAESASSVSGFRVYRLVFRKRGFVESEFVRSFWIEAVINVYFEFDER